MWLQKEWVQKWRGHSYALTLGACLEMEPPPSYKNAPRQRRVHSLDGRVTNFLVPPAFKSSYFKSSFPDIFGKREIIS